MVNFMCRRLSSLNVSCRVKVSVIIGLTLEKLESVCVLRRVQLPLSFSPIDIAFFYRIRVCPFVELKCRIHITSLMLSKDVAISKRCWRILNCCCCCFWMNVGVHYIQGDTKKGNFWNAYVKMLQSFVAPALNSFPQLHEVWFQQDGATSHTARQSMAAVRELFGNHVISRFGDIPWPPKSPDLSVCDFFFVGLP